MTVLNKNFSKGDMPVISHSIGMGGGMIQFWSKKNEI